MTFHKGAPNWLRAQPSATYSKVLSCTQLIQQKDMQHRANCFSDSCVEVEKRRTDREERRKSMNVLFFLFPKQSVALKRGSYPCSKEFGLLCGIAAKNSLVAAGCRCLSLLAAACRCLQLVAAAWRLLPLLGACCRCLPRPYASIDTCPPRL